MKKAFLCYSTDDSVYVKQVARRLGRGKIVFDEISFRPGHLLLEEINIGLDNSAVFVFFSSRKSLDSDWCKYEIKGAESRVAKNSLSAHMTVIIDSSVNVSQLPSWMKSTVVRKENSPNIAAKLIEDLLFVSALTPFRPPFIDREKETSDFERIAIDWSSYGLNLMILSGLNGVGRRSFIKKVFEDKLSIRLFPYIDIDRHNNLEDIYLCLLDELSDPRTQQATVEKIAQYRTLTETEQCLEVARLMIEASRSSCATCLIDRGGLLDDNGDYVPYMQNILLQLSHDRHESNIVILHNRRPNIPNLGQSNTYSFYLNALDSDHTILLLRLLLRRENLDISTESIRELAYHLDGYPPAAYFACASVKYYGIDALLADKSALIDFKLRDFSKFLNELDLSSLEWTIMQYLARENYISLKALSVALDQQENAIAEALVRLINCCVVFQQNSMFSLALPLREAVHRARGFMGPDEYYNIAKRLSDVYWHDNEVPSLDIIDATIHAANRTNWRESSFEPFIRVSLVVGRAREAYDMREWESARDFAKRAISISTENFLARTILSKSYIHLGQWDEAEVTISEMETITGREECFLRGFALRKRGEFGKAIEYYKREANRSRRETQAVRRELADCYYRVGKVQQAYKYIKLLLQEGTTNIWILDLACKILIEDNRLDEAEEVLSRLDVYDYSERFTHVRRAMLYAKKHDLKSAIREAEAACIGDRPAFNAVGLLVRLLIDSGKLESAEEHLSIMEKRFGFKLDIQRGLRIKLLLRQEDWKGAKEVWLTLQNKGSKIAKALLAQILNLRLRVDLLTDSEKLSLEKEVLTLSEFATSDEEMFISEIVRHDEDDAGMLFGGMEGSVGR